MDLFCCFLLIAYQRFLVCALWYPPQRIVLADACWVLCLDDVFLVASTNCCSLWYLYSLVFKLFYCLYMLLIGFQTEMHLLDSAACHFYSSHIYSASANTENQARDPIKSLLYLCFLFFRFTFNISGISFFSQECILSFFCVFSGLCKSASCNVQIGVLLCAHMLEGRFNKLGS